MLDKIPKLWRGRLSLLVLFALFFLPIIVSLVLLLTKPGWTPFGTVNRGELIQPPRELPLVAAHDASSGTALADLVAGKWVLAHLSLADCADACNEALVSMRQARLALGKDAGRVERVWLLTNLQAATRIDSVLAAFSGLRAYVVSPQVTQHFSGAMPGSIYVIDPLGRLILHYEGADSASKILKDMKRLLKISKQG